MVTDSRRPAPGLHVSRSKIFSCRELANIRPKAAANRCKSRRSIPAKYFAFSVRDLDPPIPAKSFIAIHLYLSTGAQNSLSFGTGLPAAYRLLADSLRAAHPVTFFGTRPCYAGSSGGS